MPPAGTAARTRPGWRGGGRGRSRYWWWVRREPPPERRSPPRPMLGSGADWVESPIPRGRAGARVGGRLSAPGSEHGLDIAGLGLYDFNPRADSMRSPVDDVERTILDLLEHLPD